MYRRTISSPFLTALPMKKRTKKRAKDDIVIPPITASPFEEAVSRLLKINPPEKPAWKPRKKP